MDRVLSPSQIALFAKCPHAWYLRYVEGLRGPKSPYAEIGIWFHGVIEEAVLGLLEGIDLESALQAAKEAGFEGREARTVAQAAARSVEVFVQEVLPSLHPAAVEEWVEGELGGYPVRCRLDYRDEGLPPDEYDCGWDEPQFVLDWKLTSKLTPNPEWVWEVGIQVALSGVGRGGVCMFDRNGKEKHPVIVWVAQSEHNGVIAEGVHRVGRAIEAGDCPPLGAWAERYGQCACVYCDYVHVCQFGTPWRAAAAKVAAKKEGK